MAGFSLVNSSLSTGSLNRRQGKSKLSISIALGNSRNKANVGEARKK